MPPALPPWPAPDAPAAAPGPTTRPPAAPPSRAGPPPRRAPAPPPSTPRPRDWSTARRPPAAPPAGAAAGRAAPASGSSVSSRCAVAGRRARPDRRRCTAPAASRPTAPRTRSSRPPRPPRGPSPAARSPGRAGPSGRPPRRGTAPPAPPRSSVPPPPPRVRLPQAKAQPTGCVTPQEPSPNTSAGSRRRQGPASSGLAGTLLRLLELGRAHAIANLDQQVVGERVPLAGRTREEDEPQHQVMLHAAPGGVEVADAGRRPQVALAGGLEEPARGRGVVALDPLSLRVGHGEKEHGFGVAVLRLLAELPDGPFDLVSVRHRRGSGAAGRQSDDSGSGTKNRLTAASSRQRAPRRTAWTAASSAPKKRERSCRVNGWPPPRISPASRRLVIRLRVARSAPIESGVNGRPFGAMTRAPRFTQRSASGTSAVTTMSPSPARSTIQSSARSRPSATVTRSIRGDSGTRSQPLLTTRTLSP